MNWYIYKALVIKAGKSIAEDLGAKTRDKVQRSWKEKGKFGTPSGENWCWRRNGGEKVR